AGRLERRQRQRGPRGRRSRVGWDSRRAPDRLAHCRLLQRQAPSQITGSRALPLDRTPALDWIRSQHVSELVLVNISYYRATAVFPDLAAGQASPPFRTLGQEAHYQVAGGKPVFAYRVGTELLTQSIYPGGGACG